MGTVIPLRPFENALTQRDRAGVAAPSRRACIGAVLREIHAGRNGQAVAFELQRARIAPPAQGGAA